MSRPTPGSAEMYTLSTIRKHIANDESLEMLDSFRKRNWLPRLPFFSHSKKGRGPRITWHSRI